MADKKRDNKGKRHISVKNRRATFDYEMLERYTAGIVLVGPEIKSIRAGKVGLTDSYCYFVGNELWVKNLYIAEYAFASYNRAPERRERKLLLNKRELRKLRNAVKSPGTTIVPLELFINERGLAKLVIAEARGKKNYDKRQAIKDRDDKRRMDRAMRH